MLFPPSCFRLSDPLVSSSEVVSSRRDPPQHYALQSPTSCQRAFLLFVFILFPCPHHSHFLLLSFISTSNKLHLICALLPSCILPRWFLPSSSPLPSSSIMSRDIFMTRLTMKAAMGAHSHVKLLTRPVPNSDTFSRRLNWKQPKILLSAIANTLIRKLASAAASTRS